MDSQSASVRAASGHGCAEYERDAVTGLSPQDIYAQWRGCEYGACLLEESTAVGGWETGGTEEVREVCG